MPTHVALLRGVNLGNRRVAMADLRQLTADLGHTEVATHVNSGNVVFTAGTASNPSRASNAAVAAELEREIEARTGVNAAVVVLTRDELAAVVADNPYPDEPNPKFLHVVFRATPFGSAETEAVAAAKRGPGEEATIVGGVLYLHLPNGIGRSELATQLSRKATADGTARNWSTVTKLLALLDG